MRTDFASVTLPGRARFFSKPSRELSGDLVDEWLQVHFPEAAVM
jgi:hypothetical protein